MPQYEPKDETFSVVQFFADGKHEYIAQGFKAENAVELFFSAQHTLAAQAGVVAAISITDADDYTVAHWTLEKGLTFPQNKAPHAEQPQ